MLQNIAPHPPKISHVSPLACMHVAFSLVLGSARTIRRKEVQIWHRDDVKDIRRKINRRAYMFLATYTLVVVWINLCYVVTYDTPTIW